MNKLKITVFLLISFCLYTINCQQSTTSVYTSNLSGNTNEIVITWTHKGSYTYFQATSQLNGVNIANSWMGIGLNSVPQMVCFEKTK